MKSQDSRFCFGLLATAVALTVGLCGVANAQAADSSIREAGQRPLERVDEEEVVVTAGRRDQPINEIARSVIVIDKSTLETNLIKTSNVIDLLGMTVPGYGAPTGIDIIRTNTLRGRDPQYLIDGVPLDFNGGSAFRTSPLTKFDPETLGRVEVLYGPTSIYGAGAAGGVVQFFTRDASNKPIELELRQQATFFPGYDDPLSDISLSWKSSASVSGDLGKFDYVAQLSYDSQNAIIDGNGDISGPTYYGFYDTSNYFAKAGFDITPTQRIQGFINFTDLEEDERIFDFVPNDRNYAIAELSPDQRAFSYGENSPVDEKLFYNLSYTHSDLFGGELSAMLYGRDEEIVSSFIDLREGAQLPTWPFFYPDNYQTKQEFDGSGWRLQYAREIADHISVIAGVDYDDQSQEQRALSYVLGDDFDETRALTTLDRDELFTFPYELETLGVFIQGEYEVSDRWRLSGGVRYEEPEFTISGGRRLFETVLDENLMQISRPGGSGESDGYAYNIGTSYEIDSTITVFANFAQALELPSLVQVSNLVPPDAELDSDAAIEPQVIDNYEIGLRGDVGSFEYNVAAFYSESEFGENFIFNAETGFGEYNRAPEEICGFEVSVDWAATSQFTVLTTFSWSEGEFDPDGDGPEGFVAQSALDIQPWKATVNGDYQLTDATSFNFQLLMLGNRDSAFEDGTDLYEIEGYEIVDAGLSQRLWKGTLGVQITNLFDKLYLTPASQTYENNLLFNSRVNPAPGRAVSLAYTLRI